MNILIIEPQKYMLNEWRKIAKKYGDNIYFLTNNSEFEDDEFIQIDWTKDINEICNNVNNRIKSVSAVYSCEESFVIIAEKLACKFKVELNDIETVENNRNKYTMKKLWKEHNVKCANGIFIQNLLDIKPQNNIKFPCVIKPNAGFGSFCVRVANNYEDLEKYTKYILKFNKLFLSSEKITNGIIIEEYIKGREYSIDALWVNGNVVDSFIFCREPKELGEFEDKLYYCDFKINPTLREKILTTVHRAVRATGFKYGSTHTEILVTSNNDVFVIENACRPGASGYFFLVFGLAYNCNLLELLYLIISRRFEKIHETRLLLEVDNNKTYFMYVFHAKFTGMIANIKGFDNLISRKEVEKCYLLVKKGDIFLSKDIGSRYVGWVTASVENGETDGDPYNSIKQLIDTYEDIVKVEFD